MLESWYDRQLRSLTVKIKLSVSKMALQRWTDTLTQKFAFLTNIIIIIIKEPIIV